MGRPGTEGDRRGSISNHDRGESGGDLVYPVMSRRSGGLSVGINLFPDRKTCNFSCPYCEVFPFSRNARFDPGTLRAALDRFFDIDYPRDWAAVPVRDLCISGNGEPTLSPHLEAVLDLCASVRRERFAGGPQGRRSPGAPRGLPESGTPGAEPPTHAVKIVVITNSTGFLDPRVSAVLERSWIGERVELWAKLDGANPDWFGRMSGSGIDFSLLASALGDFSKRVPVVVQTMLCRIGEFEPDAALMREYVELLGGMVRNGSRFRELHLYTKARPDFGDQTLPLGDDILLELGRIAAAGLPVPVRVFGERDELRFGQARP